MLCTSDGTGNDIISDVCFSHTHARAASGAQHIPVLVTRRPPPCEHIPTYIRARERTNTHARTSARTHHTRRAPAHAYILVHLCYDELQDKSTRTDVVSVCNPPFLFLFHKFDYFKNM